MLPSTLPSSGPPLRTRLPATGQKPWEEPNQLVNSIGSIIGVSSIPETSPLLMQRQAILAGTILVILLLPDSGSRNTSILSLCSRSRILHCQHGYPRIPCPALDRFPACPPLRLADSTGNQRGGHDSNRFETFVHGLAEPFRQLRSIIRAQISFRFYHRSQCSITSETYASD